MPPMDWSVNITWNPVFRQAGLALGETLEAAQPVARNGRRCVHVPAGQWLRLDIELRPVPHSHEPVFLLVEFLDEHYGCLSARYPAWGITGGRRDAHIRGNQSPCATLWNTGQWRRHVFCFYDFDWHLPAPSVWIGSECEVHIASVTLSIFPPDTELLAMHPGEGSLPDVVPPPVPVIVRGGPQAVSVDEQPERLAYLESLVPLLAAMGATSVETPVVWRMVEVEDGVFDWSMYDTEVAVIRRHGLGWTPLILLGPAFATPDWYVAAGESVPLKSLETSRRTPVESIWSPFLPRRIDALLRSLAAQYGDGTIDVLELGPCGILGEAAFPGEDLGWTSALSGPHYTADTFWCEDEYAARDFQMFLRGRYSTIRHLNKAWKSAYLSFEQVIPTVRANMGSARAWDDLVDFYRDAMAQYLDLWLRMVRRYFPHTAVYVRTGSRTLPQSGVDYALQAAICARHGAGLLLEGFSGDDVQDYVHSRWLVSACRHHQVPFLLHGPGEPSVPAVRGYAGLSLGAGAEGLHIDSDLILVHQDVLHAFVDDYGPWHEHAPSVVHLAAYLPKTHEVLTGERVHDALIDLRGAVEYDLVCDDLIVDEVLERYQVLVLVGGRYLDGPVMARIAEWVQSGGVLFFPALPRLETPEGRPGPLSRLRAPRIAADALVRLVPPAQLPNGYRIALGVPWDAPFLAAGEWHAREPGDLGADPFRYAREQSRVFLFLPGGVDVEIRLQYYVPIGLPDCDCVVRMGGQVVARVEGQGAGDVVWRYCAAGEGTQLVELHLTSSVWQPAMIDPAAISNEPCGLGVSAVEVVWADRNRGIEPAPFPGVEIDVPRSLRSCARRAGQGYTIGFPERSGFRYVRWVAALLSQLSRLDPTLEDIAVIPFPVGNAVDAAGQASALAPGVAGCERSEGG